MICLNQNPDRLYELVPVVYRLRDAERGYPLRALLRVIAELVNLLEQDIAGLYENWFIETCQDWVVPYIGSLLHYQPIHDAGEPGAGGDAATAARNRILFPRREVANTVRFRRRKGTLSALQELATATSGWPALVVEVYRQLGFTQNIGYPHMNRGRIIDLRDGDALDQLTGAFNESARTIDVRSGGWNLPQVRVYVWRLKSYSITHSPAYCFEQESPSCYLFNPLGIDTQLFTRPQPPSGTPGLLNLPVPIMRRNLEVFGTGETPGPSQSGVPVFYGEGKSFEIWEGNPPARVPPDKIVPADLSAWSYRPLPGQVAVDPELGRIVFSQTHGRKQGVWVTYHYGFAADMGGGEYHRERSQPSDPSIYFVGEGETNARINQALAQWQQDNPRDAVIEITDSSVYVEPISIALPAGRTLTLRAADGARPVIRMLDWQTAYPDSFSVSGEEGSWFSLEGMVITGRGMQVDGDLAGVLIRHSTLVPGWGLHCDCEPTRPDDPSIEVNGNVGCIRIEHSITGTIEVNRNQTTTDPLRIQIADSILDATSEELVAIVGPGSLCAHAVLTIARSTVFGKIEVRAIELAENSILLGSILVCRRQQGCMRFCYVTPGSRTPRRYECQPDLVEKAVGVLLAKGDITPTERDVLVQSERLRVEPEFNSTRYGTPTYCQLTDTCATEITRGAEDESEMGVFHDLYQPQRASNLKARMAEFTPAGIEAALVTATY
jgi:hypothetical protein